jgi:hypothetical protein
MQSLQEQEVHVAIWGTVTMGELSQLRDSLRSQHQRCGGKPLMYVGVVPEDAPLPDAESRKEMAHAMKEAAGFCDYLCIIFQGSGLKASAKRAAFAGLLMMAMKGKWQVSARISELIAKAGGDLRRVNQLRCAARLATESGVNIA